MSIKKAATLFLFLVLLSFAAGCELPMRLRYQFDPPQPGDVLISDDFSDPASWDTWSDDLSVVDFNSGGLRFFVNEPNYDFWSRLKQDYKDAVIQVDATKVGGPDDNSFGVFCRYENRDNFYYFLISSDGYFGIMKVLDGSHSLISSEQLQYHEQILKGDRSTNHIQAECSGPNLVLTVNDVRLAVAYDTELEWGGVGLMVGTYDEIGVDILFDNFQVTQP
jgi:hypothetical protein